MAQTVADILVERLIDWGVDTIFGLPGDGINGIFEALRTNQIRIRFVQVRHEQAAAFAACGYAKFTGRLGVCLATSGPGGVHLLNGLYDAKFDGAPVLAIAGDTFHDLIGTHYQQDVDLDKLFMDVAAYSQRVTGPAHIRNALGRRTVAHLTIPKDIQDWPATEDTRSTVRHSFMAAVTTRRSCRWTPRKRCSDRWPGVRTAGAGVLRHGWQLWLRGRPALEVSVKVGERKLLPAVRDAGRKTLVIADGFSCREQIAQRTGREALHLAQVLRMAVSEESLEQQDATHRGMEVLGKLGKVAAMDAAAVLAGGTVAWGLRRLQRRRD